MLIPTAFMDADYLLKSGRVTKEEYDKKQAETKTLPGSIENERFRLEIL